jgi:guanylate kinase
VYRTAVAARQGARAVKNSPLDAVFVFVKPPSFEALESRLRGRGTESEEAVTKRLENSKAELAAADEPGLFQHVIVNDNLDDAVAQLKTILL